MWKMEVWFIKGGWLGEEKLRDPSSCGPETCLLFFRRGT